MPVIRGRASIGKPFKIDPQHRKRPPRQPARGQVTASQHWPDWSVPEWGVAAAFDLAAAQDHDGSSAAIGHADADGRTDQGGQRVWVALNKATPTALASRLVVADQMRVDGERVGLVGEGGRTVVARHRQRGHLRAAG